MQGGFDASDAADFQEPPTAVAAMPPRHAGGARRPRARVTLGSSLAGGTCRARLSRSPVATTIRGATEVQCPAWLSPSRWQPYGALRGRPVRASRHDCRLGLAVRAGRPACRCTAGVPEARRVRVRPSVPRRRTLTAPVMQSSTAPSCPQLFSHCRTRYVPSFSSSAAPCRRFACTSPRVRGNGADAA